MSRNLFETITKIFEYYKKILYLNITRKSFSSFLQFMLILILMLYQPSVGVAVNVAASGMENLGSTPGSAKSAQCCHRLATGATFLRKQLCGLGAMSRRWAPQTPYTLRRSTSEYKERFGLVYCEE